MISTVDLLVIAISEVTAFMPCTYIAMKQNGLT